MRIHSLEVKNLLSFDTFDLTFDDKLTVLVGPNGSGKTNVIRVLDLISKGLDWADSRWGGGASENLARLALESYVNARHHGSGPDQPIRVRLEVELSTSAESELLTSYLQASLVSTLLTELAGSGNGTDISSWVTRELKEDKLESLRAGAIVLEHSGAEHASWEISYDYNHNGAAYRWVIASAFMNPGIVRADQYAPGSTSGQSERLAELLFGSSVFTTSPPSLPSPLPSFGFDALCPKGIKAVPLLVQAGGTAFDLNLEPHRRFARLARIPTSPALNRAYSLARVLRMAVDSSLVLLAEQLRGVGSGIAPARSPGLYLWDELVGDVPRREPYALPLRLFALKNGNQEARAKYERIRASFEVLAPARSFDVSFQASELPAARPDAASNSLPSWPDVDLGSLGSATLDAHTSSATSESASVGAAITVLIQHTTPKNIANLGHEIPAAQVGAGTWEALVVAEALADTESRVTVLDEPALNLHPTWQHLLRAQMREATGQIVLITHSPNLVPMGEQDDLDRIVRLENESGATRAHRLPRGLDSEIAARITREFALSADARALLFSRSVILVEGETELGVLPSWFAKAAREAGIGTPDALDIGFYCVGGDANFKPIVTVMHALATPFVVVCDGAAFNVDGNRARHIFSQVCDAGVVAPELAAFLHEKFDGQAKPQMTREIFDQQLALGRENGIFSLALGWTAADKQGGKGDESFEAFLEDVAPVKLDEAAGAVGTSKVRKGRWIAENVSCPSSVAQRYSEMIGRLRGIQ